MFGAGTVGFRWAVAPSYTKITDSSGSRFVLACVRKLSKRAAFIPPTKAEENTSPLIGDIAIVSQVSSSLAANLAIGSLSLPRSTMTSSCPDVVAAFVYEHTMSHYAIVHKPCRVIDSLVQHIRSVSVNREGPSQFHSKQHPV